MAVLTSTRDQIRVAAAARKVGGYEELVRLSQERQAAGPNAKLVVKNGRYRYVKAEPQT